MAQVLNIFHENQPEVKNMFYIMTPGTQMIAISDPNKTSFVGVSSNNEFFERFNQLPITLLTEAVNNRTRERNYFRLLSRLLSQEISENDFEKEIEENENLYVLASTIEPSRTQVALAYELSKDILSVDTPDDFLSLFSFSEEKTYKLLNDGKQ